MNLARESSKRISEGIQGENLVKEISERIDQVNGCENKQENQRENPVSKSSEQIPQVNLARESSKRIRERIRERIDE